MWVPLKRHEFSKNRLSYQKNRCGWLESTVDLRNNVVWNNDSPILCKTKKIYWWHKKKVFLIAYHQNKSRWCAHISDLQHIQRRLRCNFPVDSWVQSVEKKSKAKTRKKMVDGFTNTLTGKQYCLRCSWCQIRPIATFLLLHWIFSNQKEGWTEKLFVKRNKEIKDR